jgi:hypothetical protein
MISWVSLQDPQMFAEQKIEKPTDAVHRYTCSCMVAVCLSYVYWRDCCCFWGQFNFQVGSRADILSLNLTLFSDNVNNIYYI